jgi:DnaJ homologue, subfamily C, member 28, conserved domain
MPGFSSAAIIRLETTKMAADRPVLTERVIQIVAENKIRAAIDAGEFDNLPGFGKPCPLIDEPYDPHWWIRRKLKNEQLTPVETEARCLGWTAGVTIDDIIDSYRRHVDMRKLRENLKLTPEERLKQLWRNTKSANSNSKESPQQKNISE